MATYYWIAGAAGGTGSWDSTTPTTNWSTTSGVVTTANMPLATDDVVFNSASSATGYNVTVGTNAVCNNITVSSPGSGIAAFSFSATSILTISGNMNMTGASSSTCTWTASAAGAQIVFNATTTGKTISTGGIPLITTGSTNLVSFTGVGGGWTLGGTISAPSITVTAGTFDTGGNNVLLNLNFTVSGASSKTVTLGSSTIQLAGGTGSTFVISNLGGGSFNAGTSTINFTANGGRLDNTTGSTLAFNNVIWSSTTLTDSAAGSFSRITGNNTFSNVTLGSSGVGFTGSGESWFSVGGNQTITGTFTCNWTANTTSPAARATITTDTIGVNRTITAATVNIAKTNFRNITGAGAGSWDGTTYLWGDCGGNSGLTFPAGQTKYWVTAGTVSFENGWSLVQGSGASVNNCPLPQDNCIIDDTAAAGTSSITLAGNRSWGGLTLANRTRAITLIINGATTYFYKDLILTTSGILTLSGSTGGIVASSLLGTQTVNFAGQAIPYNFQIIAQPTSSVLLASNSTVGSSSTSLTTTLTCGILDLNNFVLTTPFFVSSNSNVRTINFRTSSKIVVTYNAGTTGQRQWDCTIVTNLSILYVNDPLVEFADMGSTQAYGGLAHGSSAGGSESNAISLSVLAGSIQFTTNNGAESFRNVTFADVYTGLVARLGIIFGNLTLSSGATYSGGTGITFAKSTGTQTVTTKGKTLTFPVSKTNAGTLQLIDDMRLNGTFTLTQGDLDLNNTVLTCTYFFSNVSNTRRILFGTIGKIIVTTSNGDPIWDTRTATGFSFTGTSRVEFNYSGVPVGTRTVRHGTTGGTEANSPSFYITAGTDIFTLGGAAATTCGDVDFTGFQGTFGGSGAVRTIYGNWTFSSGMTVSPTTPDTITFASTLSKTITSNGKSFPGAVGFNGGNGVWSLQDNMLVGTASSTTLTNGTLNLNGKTATTGSFATGTGTKSITFNGGTLECTASGATAFNNAQPTGFTTSGVGRINMSSATAKTFAGGGSSYSCAVNQGGLGALTITGNNTLNSITNTVSPATISLTSGTTTTVSTLGIAGSSASSKITFNATTPSSAATLSCSTPMVYVKNCDVVDSNAIGGAIFRAPTNYNDTTTRSPNWVTTAWATPDGLFFTFF